MNLRDLQYFSEVVEYQSFSKAAKALHISQPSLSTAIQKLEQTIGTVLIERSTRSFRLTTSGNLLYERAKEILLHIDTLEEELKDIATGNHIEIVIGMIESVKYWLAKAIKKHLSHSPNPFRLIDTLDNKSVIHSLLSYEVHAVITNQLIANDNIQSHVLYEEPFVAVAHHTNPIFSTSTMTLKNLAQSQLILGLENFQTRQQITAAFHAQNIMPHIAFQTERFEMSLVLAEKQLGVAILPKLYVEENLQPSLRYKIIEDEHLKRFVYFSYVKERHFPNSINRFFQTIIQQ